MKKRYLLSLIIMIVAVLGFTQRAQIAERLISSAMQKQFTSDAIGALADGLHVGLCGAGGPLPSPRASGACILVIAGKREFVFDVGTNGARNITLMGFQPGAVEAVFLTHFHSDHIDGLGELATLRWAGGDFDAPLPVHGPSGVEQIVSGFNMAYSQDFTYRHAHHGDSVTPLASAGLAARPFDLPAEGQGVTVYDQDDIEIEAFAVDHAPVFPAVGYRIRYRGRSAVISGDTSKSDNLIQFAKGADLLAHEALATNIVAIMQRTATDNNQTRIAKIASDIPDYHASPIEAAESAKAAGVRHLLYYHIVPPLRAPGQEALFLNGADAIFPHYTIGYDGTFISLPTQQSDQIEITSRL